MAWIGLVRTRFAALRQWSARALLRPDFVTLYHRPGGSAETGDAAAPGDSTA
jgi:hypothetical protein